MRVEATTELNGDELVVRIDAKGLAYPVLLDPVLEVPIWQDVSSGPYAASADDSLAWNPITGNTTLVGGQVTSPGPTVTYPVTDAYTWSGSTWSGLGVSAVLAQRSDTALSDWGTSSSGGITAYGGRSSKSTLGDTWIYSGSWGQLCGPCMASYATGSYRWTLPSTTSDPVYTLAGSASSAQMPVMAHAVAANYETRLLMFGTDRNTYTYDGSNGWTCFPLTLNDVSNSSPGARTNACMAGDTTAGHVILVGGNPMVKNAPDSQTYLSDAWEFVPTATGGSADPHWKPLCGTGALVGCPFSPRGGCAMAFDTSRNKAYLSGGNYGGADANDLWEFDDGTKAWTQLLPMGNSVGPTREGAGMAFDRGRTRVVLAGGSSGTTYYNETWESVRSRRQLRERFRLRRRQALLRRNLLRERLHAVPDLLRLGKRRDVHQHSRRPGGPGERLPR